MRHPGRDGREGRDGVRQLRGVFRSTDGGASWEAIFFFVDRCNPTAQPAEVNHDGGWFDWDVGFGTGGPAMVRDDN